MKNEVNKQIAVCIKDKFGLTTGKHYEMLSIDDERVAAIFIRITNDFGFTYYYPRKPFEIREANPQQSPNDD